MSRALAGFGVAALLLGGGAVIWYRSGGEVVEKPAPSVPPTPSPTPAAAVPEQAPVPAPAPAAKPAPAAALVTFPDGSTAPALNGVTTPLQLTWNDRPFSKIKSKIVQNGLEWYVHEDGTQSTVQMIDVNGVPQAVGVVASPTDPVPVFDQPAPGAANGGKR